MKFVDEVRIHVKAGDGGDGVVAFRHEDGVPRGGPSGGDGGDGGSIVVLADPGLSSLLDYKYQRHYKAERGEDGRNKDQYGAAGDDLVLKVPVGTVIYDDASGDPLVDLDAANARFVLAQGGTDNAVIVDFALPGEHDMDALRNMLARWKKKARLSAISTSLIGSC